MTSDRFEPVRMAVIGCGGMGIRHALAVAEMKALGCSPVEIVAVCDADPGRRDRLAALLAKDHQIHAKVFADAAALLQSPDVEAVDIVLPTWMHHSLVLDALAAEKHVLVEKPLALTVAACDLIVEAADRSGRVVAVSENYRRIPSNRAMGQLLRSGRMGQLNAMFVRNIASVSRPRSIAGRQIVPPPWYHDRSRAGGYHSLELAVHEADLQHYWFGDIETVSAQTAIFGARSRRDQDADADMLTASLTFASGFVSHLSFCSASPGVNIADRLLVGDEAYASSGAWHAWQDGSISLRGGEKLSPEAITAEYVAALPSDERATLLPTGSWDEVASSSISTKPLTYGVGTSIYDFARAVRSNLNPEVDARMGRLAVAICYAMQESSALEGSIGLVDVLAGRIAGAQVALNHAIGLA